MICWGEWGNKLSLKDRFNTSNAKNSKIVELEKQILTTSYYASNEEAQNTVSLGVLDTLIDDDDINAIFVNGARNIFIERKTRLHRSTTSFRDDIQLENIISKNSNSSNKFIKFNYKPGINVVATLPPLTNMATMYVKCYRDKFATLESLDLQQAVSKEISIFLQTLLKNKHNIIIAGNKKTLKTTLLSALAKKSPVNTRYDVIDFSKEFQIDKSNFANYDLSDISENKEKEQIIKSVFSSTPEGIFINDLDFEINCVIKNLLDGYKGLILNIEAKSKEEALEKISTEVLKAMPHIDMQTAKEITYNIFDFIIFVENKEEKKISSISEILLNDNNALIKDIFLLNEANTHYSTGYTPVAFLEDNSDSINLNIFDSEYKHTYSVSPFKDTEKRGVNPEILKKFRKDLNIESFEKFNQESVIAQQEQNPYEKIDSKIKEQENNHEEQITQQVEVVYDEEFAKKAQEKFDEVRKNLKSDENEQ